jgi:hypothetical protein
MPDGGVAAVKTYDVVARRWDRGWELHIGGIGVTQSRRLTEAEEMVRDYILLDRGEHDFEVRITPELSPGLDREVRRARKSTAEAAQVVESAAARSRDAARRLRAEGLTGRDIAIILGVSPQRVSQLLHG